MRIKNMISAGISIWKRLSYLSRHGREDITLFADFARKEFSDPKSVKLHKLRKDFGLWVKRVEGQIELEKDFSLGCRLGTFANSPVLQLRDHFALPYEDRTSPWCQKSLENHYRNASGLDHTIDAEMETHAGYSVKSIAAALTKQFHDDPTLAYLILCRELQLAAAHHFEASGSEQFSRDHLIDQFAHLEKNIVAHAAAMAMHEYLWSIVKALRNAKEVDSEGNTTAVPLNAVALKQADYAQRKYPGIVNPNYDDHLNALEVSVPALYVAALNMKHEREAGLDEVHNVFGQRSGKGGRTTNPPIFSYYGLTWKPLLAVGTLEILIVMVGLHKGKRLHGVHPRLAEGARPSTRLTGDIVDRMPSSAMPGWNDFMRKVGHMRKCYLPPAHNACGGGRFDPSLLLDPVKDWKAYDKMARGDLSRKSLKRGAFKRNFDEIRFRLACSSFAFAAATGLVIANPNEASRWMRIRRRGSQVVALLASSLTNFSADPVFVSLLERAIIRSGYQHSRGKKGRQAAWELSADNDNPKPEKFVVRISNSAPMIRKNRRLLGLPHGLYNYWGQSIATDPPFGRPSNDN